PFAVVRVAPILGSGLTPQLTVGGPDSVPLDSFFVAGDSRYYLPAIGGGRHQVAVSSSGGTTGGYTLQVSLFTIVFTETPSTGRFTCTNQSDGFFFAASPGQLATITMTRLDGDLVPTLRLADYYDYRGVIGRSQRDEQGN